ncbi:unnamed protein product [Diabrotica balteata]|uniref:Uncharacterized protein n=1 Tax=Diabrotica balteata TaxID=107213 RepID=A0A9N9SQV4_DIABA|nr:unnamed protein product [Diabrotica balteata]
MMVLVVFLLEQAVLIAAQEDNKEDSKMCSTAPLQSHVSDMDLATKIVQNLDWDSTEINAADSGNTMLMFDQASSNNNWDGEEQEQSESLEVMVFRPQAMETISSVVETPATTPRLMFALPFPMEVDRITSLAVREMTPSVTKSELRVRQKHPLPLPDARPVILAGNEVGRTIRKSTKAPGASSSGSRTGTTYIPTTFQGHRKSRSNKPLRVISNFPPVVKVNERVSQGTRRKQ